jgi:flagellar motor switch protein FliG
VHLERDQAASVLSYFTEERKQGDVMMRIATLDGINPIALKELNDTLGKILLGGKDQLKKSTLGGVRTAAEILNFASGTTEQIVMDALKTQDPDMAQKIQDEMFVFDNILDIDNRGIQAVLREVQSESLILSLKGASQDIRNKILSNMSSRAAEALREDLESRGPVKLSDVEKEQKEILKIVRRLAEEGTIQLSGKGDDAYV